MRYGKEVRILIKTLGTYNLIIGGITSILLSFFLKIRVVFFILGILFAFVNLIVNSYTIKISISKRGGHRFIIVTLSLMIRIMLICGLAIVLFFKSEVNFFAFIGGYIYQVLPILIYGFKLKNQKVR